MMVPSWVQLSLLFVGAVTGSPTSGARGDLLPRREAPASIDQACSIGYCTQNGGTTGGAGGAMVRASTLADLTAAAASVEPLIIVVDGSISGSVAVRVNSNKSIIGAPGSSLTGIGLTVSSKSNVILRNLRIAKVTASAGDAITIQASRNVWVDHCDLSSDLDHGKDFYDGLCDVTHGSEWVTVSNSRFHDHYKASLVGHSDRNAAEDTGRLHVTYAGNLWERVNSRAPSFRFGTGHIYNSYFTSLPSSAVNSRMGAQLLVQSCVFDSVRRPIESVDSDMPGFVTVDDVKLEGAGAGRVTAPQGTLSAASIPYAYELLGSENVRSTVMAEAGQTLQF